MNTLQLLSLCQQGDPLALERLVTILEDGPEAEEIAQDVLVAALKSLGSYRGK